MKTTLITDGGLALLAAVFLAACGSHEGKAQGAPGAAGAQPEVNVVTTSKGAALLTQDLPGRLEAYRVAQIRARVDGIVEKRLFAEGSDVQAGQTLFQIDARSYRAAYDSARADVEVARQNLHRDTRLLETKMLSQQDYDLAAARLKQAEAALAHAQLDLENTRVPAPISGRIGRAMVTEGALVGHGEATTLATIEQIDPVYANFTEPGSDVLRLQKAVASGRLKQSDSVKVVLVMEDGSTYARPGKLLFSDLAADPSTGGVSVRAEFPNPQHELLPGMFVVVRFPQAIADDAMLLPQRAVMVGPQGQFVLVVDAASKVTFRPVKTGSMAGEDFVIEDGLQAGEKVIVDGVQKVRPGDTVKAVPVGTHANVMPPQDRQ